MDELRGRDWTCKRPDSHKGCASKTDRQAVWYDGRYNSTLLKRWAQYDCGNFRTEVVIIALAAKIQPSAQCLSLKVLAETEYISSINLLSLYWLGDKYGY